MLPVHVETDPVAMSEMLVGLPGMVVLGTAVSDGEIEIHVMLEAPVAACSSCGVPARFKGWRTVVLRLFGFQRGVMDPSSDQSGLPA